MEENFNDLTVLVPTLNEEEAIGKVLDEILSEGIKPSQILVVDGHSKDKTREIAAGRGVRVILQEGKGKAAAIKSAIPHIDTRNVLIMDGDYTYPAKHIKELLKAKLEKDADEVIGVRRFDEKSQNKIFRFGNWVLNKAFNVIFGAKLRDVLSGMYLVDKEVLESIDFSSKNFGIESEIAAHVVATGGTIAEVPIEYRERLGEKKLKVRHGIEILREVINLALKYNPTFFIFIIGSLLLVPGLALGAWVAYQYIQGVNHHVKGLVAIFLTVGGFQSLLIALQSLYLKRQEIRLLNAIKRLAKRT